MVNRYVMDKRPLKVRSKSTLMPDSGYPGLGSRLLLELKPYGNWYEQPGHGRSHIFASLFVHPIVYEFSKTMQLLFDDERPIPFKEKSKKSDFTVIFAHADFCLELANFLKVYFKDNP